MKAEEARALATVAGGIAHELRTPLSTMEINLQLLEEEWRSPVGEREKRARKRIESLSRATLRMKEILDTFVMLFQQRSLRVETLSLNELVQQIVESDLGERLSGVNRLGKVHLKYEFDPALPDTVGDRVSIRQAMLNLLANAIDWVPEGGIVEIRTFRENGAPAVSVVDNGPGIAAENLQKIWEPYYSTKPAGIGLGLPVARRFLEMNGATIRVESNPGKGTVFTVLFRRRDGGTNSGRR